MTFVLGVDGGATKTFAIVADERGHIRGFGQGGPGNHETVGLDSALTEIARACKSALAQSDVTPPVECAVFGLAGADLPTDFDLLSTSLQKLGFSRKLYVENDAVIALRAGLKRGWGVGVVCGTGFNACGIGPDGTKLRFPGLGWISGDWGGGVDIAREVIRLVCRAWDGRGRPTMLAEKVPAILGFSRIEEMIAHLRQEQLAHYPGWFDRRRLFKVVPLVFEAAYNGDEVAQDLLIRLGNEVGLAASAIIRRLGLEGSDVEVILAGGVFKGRGPLLLDAVTLTVHRVAPRAKVVIAKFEPVVGAVLLALEGLGIEITDDIYANLEATLPHKLSMNGLSLLEL
jgi:N-acetylglucosamine kinase-like BadF-type ATPase